MPSRVVPEPILLDDGAAAALLPPRPVRGHKGTFGKLLVIAGSVDYAGAALLVCTAAGWLPPTALIPITRNIRHSKAGP